MERKESIRKNVADMLAVDSHILEAIERQREDEKVRAHPEANELIIRIERLQKEHVAALQGMAEHYGTGGESGLKKAVTSAMGVVAGLYDRVREQKLSRMLRDNYTALSLAAMSYTAMHTFGLAVNEEKVAGLALRHLRDVTPILVEISKVLPVVVAEEVGEEIDVPVDVTVSRLAVENTQEAWAPEHV